jgi:hypothetical protein
MLAKTLGARLDKVLRASPYLEKRIFGKRLAVGVASLREMLVKSPRNVCELRV